MKITYGIAKHIIADDRRFRAARFYYYARNINNGRLSVKFHIGDESMFLWKQYNNTQIRKYVEDLRLMGWVRVDLKNGWVFFNSIEKINNLYCANSRGCQSANVTDKYWNGSVSDFRRFVAAVFLSATARHIEWKSWAAAQSETRKEVGALGGSFAPDCAAQVSLSLIASSLGIDKSRAQLIRRYAEQSGLCSTDQNVHPLWDSEGQPIHMSWNEFLEFKESVADGHKYRLFSTGHVCLQCVSTVHYHPGLLEKMTKRVRLKKVKDLTFKN